MKIVEICPLIRIWTKLSPFLTHNILPPFVVSSLSRNLNEHRDKSTALRCDHSQTLSRGSKLRETLGSSRWKRNIKLFTEVTWKRCFSSVSGLMRETQASLIRYSELSVHSLSHPHQKKTPVSAEVMSNNSIINFQLLRWQAHVRSEGSWGLNTVTPQTCIFNPWHWCVLISGGFLVPNLRSGPPPTKSHKISLICQETYSW